MSKRERNRQEGAPAPAKGASDTSPWLARIAMLAGLGVLIYLNGSALREVRESRQELGDRLARIEGQFGPLSAKVDAAARAAAPQQRGPDPNRVYTIRTEGSPAKGPATAPIVIAEFSDFQ